jgi:hypothetical protein
MAKGLKAGKSMIAAYATLSNSPKGQLGNVEM